MLTPPKLEKVTELCMYCTSAFRKLHHLHIPQTFLSLPLLYDLGSASTSVACQVKLRSIVKTHPKVNRRHPKVSPMAPQNHSQETSLTLFELGLRYRRSLKD